MIKHPDVLRAASRICARSCMPGEVGRWLRLYRAYACSVRCRHLFAEALTAQTTPTKTDRSLQRGVMVGIINALKGQNCTCLSGAPHRQPSACRSCSARLLLYVRRLGPRMYRQRASYSCEQCQADLPTFIDLELDNPVQAAQAYPHLWWHLRLCPGCAQTYACTYQLLDAERAGYLAPPYMIARAALCPVALGRRVRLTWQLLALSIPRSLAAASGRADEGRRNPPQT